MPARNIVIGQNVSPAKVQRARELRQHMTAAENRLWQAVRANRLNGWHFRRQQVIGSFIADFYCHAASLVVELDGGIHAAQKEYDQERTEIMNTHGIETLRFTNEQVLQDLPGVLREIGRVCQERTSIGCPAGKEPGER